MTQHDLALRGGQTRRANSVNPRGIASRRDLGDKIAVCVALYQAQGLPAIFRLPSMIEPELAALLDQLGYRAEGETRVLYADLAGPPRARDPGVDLSPKPSEEWLAAMGDVQQYSAPLSRAYRQMLKGLAIPAIFSAIRVEGRIASLGYAAVHDGLACINSVATSPDRRRRGLSTKVITAALAWAQETGATGACLQVQADNAPAIALYGGMGFRTELYRYHYRRKAPSD